MNILSTELEHLKNHVTYPANRAAIVAACSNMSDVPKEDAEWFTKNLPEGEYENTHDVMKALLAKV